MNEQEIREEVESIHRQIAEGDFNQHDLKEFGKQLDLNSAYGLHVYTNLCMELGKYKALAVAKKQAENMLYWIERS